MHHLEARWRQARAAGDSMLLLIVDCRERSAVARYAGYEW